MFVRSSVVMTAVVVGTAAAQSPARTAGDSLHPRDTLAAAVITATRVPVATAAPTASTTVLSGADLRAQGITRVADALRLVPGADVVASGPVGSQTSLFLRGGNSNYVRVLVDGVPMNDAGGSIDLANLALDNVDRIEVVRGPASVLYGSDAVTGVVQIFTADGTGPSGLRASLAGGTRGSLRASVGTSGGDAWARYSLGAAREATSGILPFNNEYRNDVLSGALRLAPDARSDVRMAARWAAGDYHYPTDYSGAVVDHNAEQVDHRFTASVDAGRRLTDRIELRTTLTSNEYLPRTNNPPDGPADTLGFYGFFSRSVRTRRAADVRMNVRAGARGAITLGAEASHDRERTTSRSLSQYGNSSNAFEASRHIGGVYAQAIGDATDRLSYVVGVRRDDNSAFGVFTTARAGLAWLLGPDARVRVAAGNAFRAPSFFENFATGYVTGNPALRPEESRSVELGGDLTLNDGALRLTGTAYAQRFRNIVQYSGTAPTPGAPNYYNVAAADANGLELEAAWRATERLTGTLTWALTDTRVTASGFDTTSGASYVRGEALIRRPRHTVSAALVRTFGDGGVVRLQAIRIGERTDRDYAQYPVAAVTLPAFVKVDLAAVVPSGLHRVALTLRADNLLDARYEEIKGFRAPGVTLLAGFSYRP